MKLYWLLLLWTFNTNAQWFFGQGEAVNLTNRIKYNSGQTSEVGVLDPSVSGLARSIGSTYSNTTTGKMYVKTTAPSTGWEEVNVGAPVVPTNFLPAEQAVSNWYLRSTPLDVNWQSVTYGNGLFVAVNDGATGARVMTSPDGVSWTLRATPADNGWYDVAYGNGRFVAVAYSGGTSRAMYSVDGVNWTLGTTTAETNSWQSVTYGNGLFVAVSRFGTNGFRVMTSPDGATWTLRATPTPSADRFWESITYGNGLFVAVASNGTGTGNIMTSPDGINWEVRQAPNSNAWLGLAYGNGVFVATSYTGTGNRAMTSPDGINWTSRSTPADVNYVGLTFGNGLFVSLNNTSTGNRVMVSPDGIRWTQRTTPADNGWFSVTYGNGVFVAVARTGTGNRVMTSPFYDLYSYSDAVFKSSSPAEYASINNGYERFEFEQNVPLATTYRGAAFIEDDYMLSTSGASTTCQARVYKKESSRFLTLDKTLSVGTFPCGANASASYRFSGCSYPYAIESQYSAEGSNKNTIFLKWDSVGKTFTQSHLITTTTSREVLDFIDEGSDNFIAIWKDTSPTTAYNPTLGFLIKPAASEAWTTTGAPTLNRNIALAPTGTWVYIIRSSFLFNNRDYIWVEFQNTTNTRQGHIYKYDSGTNTYVFTQQFPATNYSSPYTAGPNINGRGNFNESFKVVNAANTEVTILTAANNVCKYQMVADVLSEVSCFPNTFGSSFGANGLHISTCQANYPVTSGVFVMYDQVTRKEFSFVEYNITSHTLTKIRDSSLFDSGSNPYSIAVFPNQDGIVSVDGTVTRLKVNLIKKPRKVAP